jgi:hypothetical protein
VSSTRQNFTSGSLVTPASAIIAPMSGLRQPVRVNG